MRTFAERSARPGSASVGPARLPSASFVAQRYRAAAAPYAAGHDISRISVFPPAAQPAQAQPAGETHTIEQQYRLSARIRRADTPRSATPGSGARPLWADFDSSEEGEEQPVVTREVGAVMEEESDSIAPTLTYSPTISQGGVTPGASEFGVTQTTTSIANITVAPAGSVFNVSATVKNTINWAVQSRGRTDIPNENAAAITSANYATVASDLTPNMSSDNGRPPRTQFWAQDLTERHERFHANERAYTYGQPAFEFAQNWLKSQTATDAAGATALVNQVPNKMHESYATSYAPGKESRAYGDGAPSYRARADAIKAKGDGGGYPAPPAAP